MNYLCVLYTAHFTFTPFTLHLHSIHTLTLGPARQTINPYFIRSNHSHIFTHTFGVLAQGHISVSTWSAGNWTLIVQLVGGSLYLLVHSPYCVSALSWDSSSFISLGFYLWLTYNFEASHAVPSYPVAPTLVSEQCLRSFPNKMFTLDIKTHWACICFFTSNQSQFSYSTV